MTTVSSNIHQHHSKHNSHEKQVTTRFRALEPPLRQHTKLNLTENQLVGYLKHYILDETLLRLLGFPIEYDLAPNFAIIYKYPPYEFLSTMRKDKSITSANVNQNGYYSDQIIVNANDGLTKENFGSEVIDSDSGQGSGSSSPSVEGEYEINNSNNGRISQVKLQSNAYMYTVSPQRQCIRCGKGFFVTYDGEYVTQEHCSYHWGKLYRTFNNSTMKFVYSCCNREYIENETNGCAMNRFHVWTGLNSGLNGPFEGYVRTKPRSHPPGDGNTGIFALDCEMCFTGCGLELTKVTIIRSDGRMHYQTFVRPEHDIVDYNTRFSGITEKDLTGITSSRRSSTASTAGSKTIYKDAYNNNTVKTLKEVQNDILKFIFNDTLLVGHSIDNDLRALKLIHKTIIDTSISFPHFYGLPYRRSLKSLTKSVLKREIQQSETGHCSFEDSRACLELMLWKVRKDFRTILEQS
jgi:RNA exonuclease 1